MSSAADLTVLSLGAGVQSTTLALLAEDGTLPRPDYAIFADTGWEPRSVYEHLDRLEKALSFPILRVAKGNLRNDVLSESTRFAAVPFYILAPEGNVPVQIDCPDCTELDDDCPRCSGSGLIDDPAGTTRPVTRDERLGMGRRQCTNEYKLSPIRRKVRELLGAKAPDFRTVPRGKTCDLWIGFSVDEVQRANRRRDSDGVSYVSIDYPLLDLGMSRKDCDRWLRARGWGDTAKSACIGCPYHGNRQWRELRDNNPEEWRDAVAFDEALRDGSRMAYLMRGSAFLHRSRLPLAEAPIDRVTRGEWREAQTDLFDAVADQQIEDEMGDPDGCSPFGCRSGISAG